MTNQHSDHEQTGFDDRLAPAKRDVPSDKRNDQPIDFARLAQHPLYRGVQSAKRSGMGAERPLPSQATEKQNPDDLLAELCETRERLLAGMDYLVRHQADDERFTRGRRRLIHILVEEYRPRIEQLRTVAGAEELTARRDDIERRLTIGWGVDKPGADERFAELAVISAVLSDALDGTGVVAPWLDRIGLWEASAA